MFQYYGVFCVEWCKLWGEKQFNGGEYLCMFPTFTLRVCRLLHSAVSLFVWAPLQIFLPSLCSRLTPPPSLPPSRRSLSPVPAAHWSHGCMPELAAGTTSGTETMTPPALMAFLARRPSVPLRGRNETRRGDKDRRRPSRCILLFIPFRGQEKKSERTGNYTVI